MEFCEEHSCVDCCFEADVPLLNEDINRITSLGYYDAYFADNDNNDGVKKLRKICGKCVFYDEGRCEVYQHRPERCKLYPLSYDGSRQCVTLDDRCKYSGDFEVPPGMNRKMLKYVETLRREIEWRMKTGVML